MSGCEPTTQEQQACIERVLLEGIPGSAQQELEQMKAGLRAFIEPWQDAPVIVGLSGGMDSALVAALAVQVLGAERVRLYALPGPYSSESSLTDAYELAENLGCDITTLSIEGMFNAAAHELELALEDGLQGLAAENTQARCRMVFLMAITNALGGFMLNTGNKSEYYMGYSTLYGDSAGAFAPLKDLFKTQVYRAARAYNQEMERVGSQALIPENIFTKEPSAELAPNQTDAKSLGLAYEELDPVLYLLIDQDIPAQVLAEHPPIELTEEQLANIEVRYRAAEFKRKLAPEGPSDVLGSSQIPQPK